jgi:hypothetical protein
MHLATLHWQDTIITGALYVAFELGDRRWKLSLGNGARAPSRLRGGRRRYGRSFRGDCEGQGALSSGRRCSGAQL